MKRMAVLITAAALACTVGAMGVSAAGRTRSRGAACTRQACAFVDADGDGVCDYRTGGCRYDADGDGVCDRAACGRFVDEDGDGLCDNRPAGGCDGPAGRHSNQPMGARACAANRRSTVRWNGTPTPCGVSA